MNVEKPQKNCAFAAIAFVGQFNRIIRSPMKEQIRL